MNNEFILQQREKLSTRTFHNTQKFTFKGIQTVARVVDIIDGDTMTCILQFNDNYYKITVRLTGIDTCEIRTTNPIIKKYGIMAKKTIIYHLTDQQLMQDETDMKKNDIHKLFNEKINCIVWIECSDFDKYGRVLANVYKIKNENNDFIKDTLSLSEFLLHKKLAYVYKGEHKPTEQELLKLFLN